MKTKVLILSITSAAIGALLFFGVGVFIIKKSQVQIRNINELTALARDYKITEQREQESRFMIHNLALALKRRSQGPDPEIIVLGSSRTKPLALHAFTNANSLNLAGNSYGEMPLALLAEAEMAHRIFPGVSTFLIEASFLFRKPANMQTEPDHQKYSFLLSDLGLRSEQKTERNWRIPKFSEVMAIRDSVRISHFFRSQTDFDSSKELRPLDIYGENNPKLFPYEGTKNWNSIAAQNPKVVRILNNANNIPGDGLFAELIRWSKKNGIRLVLFIPPVRSDFLEIKYGLGLQKHIDDLVQITQAENVELYSFLESGEFKGRVNLFADEDHLTTCFGTGLLSKRIGEALAKKAWHFSTTDPTTAHEIAMACGRTNGNGAN